MRWRSSILGSGWPGRWRILAWAAIALAAVVSTEAQRIAWIDDPTEAVQAVIVIQVAALAVVLTLVRAGAGLVLALASYVLMAVLHPTGDTAGSAQLWPGPAVAAGLYAVVRTPERRRWPWLIAGAAVLAVTTPVKAVTGFPEPVFELVFDSVLLALVVLAAEVARRRRSEVLTLQQRAMDLDRMRVLEAEVAVAEERARIARELHDVLAHTTTAIVLQAGTARRVALRRPQDAEAALADIESAGRAAMSEIRSMVAVTRNGDAGGPGPAPEPASPPESLDDVRRIVTSSHLPVRLSVQGPPVEVPGLVGHAAFRIVQEALTNIRKHAPETSEVTVAVTLSPRDVRVEVTDTGPGEGAAVPAPVPGGYGLVGMAERARRLDGTVVAGPRDGAPGWQVEAVLPLRSQEVPA